MFHKNIETVNESDLKQLIEDQISERKTLDYKEELNIDTDADKKEFLADVSSFANTSGGELLIGITEDKGLPIGIPGLDIADSDKESLRIEQIIRDGLQSRIIGIQISWVALSNSRKVLIIGIPKSWNSPHKVSFKGWDKFFRRNSCGKYALDVPELKSVFLLSDSITERIRRFKADRIASLITNDTPIQLVGGAKIAVHMIPLSSFDVGQVIDLKQIYETMPNLMGSSGKDHRYNFDGVLIFGNPYFYETKQVHKSYVQYYRNGTIETVVSGIFSSTSRDEDKHIHAAEFEKSVVKFVTDKLEILRQQNIVAPIYIFITLIGVKGYKIPRQSMTYSDQSSPIDRDILMLPEALIDDNQVNVHSVLKDAINTLWNACGYEGSRTYDIRMKSDHRQNIRTIISIR
jgi:hypothetical protein